MRIINNEHLVTVDIGDGSFGGNTGMADSKFELSSIDFYTNVIVDLSFIKILEFRGSSMNNFVNVHVSSNSE